MFPGSLKSTLQIYGRNWNIMRTPSVLVEMELRICEKRMKFCIFLNAFCSNFVSFYVIEISHLLVIYDGVVNKSE